MPEITIIHIAFMAGTALIGAIVGWVLRGNRSEQEKAAVNAGWQEQIDAQRREGNRLLEQNKGLMEQINQFQASYNDAKNRAKELSAAVQEAFARRDDLQREIKDIRGNLEVVVNERDQLQSDIAARGSDEDSASAKDAKIEKLKAELENWQNRLPPLIDRFRVRNEEAEQLEAELEQARERIQELESSRDDQLQAQTRIEPVHDPEELTDGLDASNDPAGDTSISELLRAATEAEFNEDPEIAADDEREEQEAEPESESELESGHESRDDLQRIKGIGPAIKKTLNEMGIFRFQQIADMSEYDIDRVATRLKGFRSRIYREDWIGQARELRDQHMHA